MQEMHHYPQFRLHYRKIRSKYNKNSLHLKIKSWQDNTKRQEARSEDSAQREIIIDGANYDYAQLKRPVVNPSFNKHPRCKRT